MGNSLSARMFGDRPAEPTWCPNIAPDCQDGFNNVNRPYSVQMKDMVLQFAVPLLFIAAFAVRENRHRSLEKEWMRRHEKELQTCRHLQEEQDTKRTSLNRDVIEGHLRNVIKDDLRDVISNVEVDAEKKRQKSLETIELYDQSLKEIMHIKCSTFKRKEVREKMEDQLVTDLGKQSADLFRIATYSDVKNVIQHDSKFCGDSKESNGKLRQLNVQNWKLLLELEKQRSILRKIKEVIYPED